MKSSSMVKFISSAALFLAGLILCFLLKTSSAQVGSPPEDNNDLHRQALAAKQAADAYSKSGEIQKAIEAYEKALQLYPDYADVYYLLGLIYDLHQGRLEKAIACYQRFLELAPNAPEARDVQLLIESARQALSDAQGISPKPAADAQGISTKPAATFSGTEGKDEGKIQPLAEGEQKNADKINDYDKVEEQVAVSQIGPATFSKDIKDDSHIELHKELADSPQEVDKKTKQKSSLSGKGRSASEAGASEQFISRSIEGKILKYTIKLAVWQREGFIDKFNELALARGSYLTNNVSEVRAKLREERQKVTEFIDYAKEAEQMMLRQLLNELIKEWGIELPHLPQKVDIEKAVSSIQVQDLQEDKKYIHLSLEAKVNAKNLREQLLKLGYQFTPCRVHLQCSNLYGEFKDKFFEAIQRKSEYIKSQSEGVYEIYAPAKLFASELSKMVIGTYGIRLDKVGEDTITFRAEAVENGF
ncbi:MAG: tetratricopeptide repeat protein [bacterium]|nr:tetratricopeptide repeat protein [bacterium]